MDVLPARWHWPIFCVWPGSCGCINRNQLKSARCEHRSLHFPTAGNTVGFNSLITNRFFLREFYRLNDKMLIINSSKKERKHIRNYMNQSLFVSAGSCRWCLDLKNLFNATHLSDLWLSDKDKYQPSTRSFLPVCSCEKPSQSLQSKFLFQTFTCLIKS